jgi:hypothetical protein
VGEDQVDKEEGAELGNGFVASVVAGEGAIDPYERSCGRVWGLPPPCLRRTQGGEREMPLGPPMASCSPVGGGGRLFPATLESESTGEMVEVPARMPAHSRASTPSRDGREGIGTGVSRCPKGNWRIPSFLYYSYCRKGNNTPKPSIARAGRFLLLCQVGKGVAMQRRLPPAENIGDNLALVVPIPKTQSALMGHNLSQLH